LQDGKRLVFQSSKRGVRAVRIVRRTRLPRFRRDLGDLPPLTEHLTLGSKTDHDFTGQLGIENSLKDLWNKKLQVYKAYMPDNFKPVLLESMYDASNDIDKTLRLIDLNLETMTSFYVANSFEIISDQVHFEPSYKDTVLVSPEFKRLCKKTLLKMRFFESDELLKLIICLSRLQLPENTVIVQSTLQMIRHLINDFNYEELDSLKSTLESFEVIDNSKKNLLVILKDAIPLAMQLQIDQKLFTKSYLDKESSKTMLEGTVRLPCDQNEASKKS